MEKNSVETETNGDFMSAFAGIDIGDGHTYSCVLDLSSKTFIYPECRMSLEETLSWLGRFPELKGACIDGPPQTNTGVLERWLKDTGQNTNKRLTEFQIGIGGCYSTPMDCPKKGATNYWMNSSFGMFALLEKQFGWSINMGGGQGELIETHPTFAFKAILGCKVTTENEITRYKPDPQSMLRKKHSQAGKAQRVELLERLCSNVGILLGKEIIEKWNTRIDWIDAAICALMSCWKNQNRPGLIAPGDPNEGAIYLWSPETPESVTSYPTSIKHRTTESKTPSSIPNYPLEGKFEFANAIILRLGNRKGRNAKQTGILSQSDTIDTIISSEDLNEFWLPIGSGTMKKLCANLELVSGRLFLAWESRLQISLIVTDCQMGIAPIIYPSQEGNPWPMDTCHCWVRVENAKQCDIDQFYVNHNKEWKQGFTEGQAALVWAIVRE